MRNRFYREVGAIPMKPSQTGSMQRSPRPDWRTRLPFYYGWVVVGSMFLVQAIGHGPYYSFSVFFVALLEEFGWGRAPAAGAFSLFVVIIGIGGLGTGALVDRFGPNRVVAAGAVLLSAGLAASSRMAELWQFYLYFGVLGALGTGLAGWVPCVTVVSNWFQVRRGLAIGIASAGMGLGIVVMVPFSQYLIESYGWRNAYLVLAGICLLGLLPQAGVLVGRPENLGMKPDGRSDPSPAGPPAAVQHARDLVVDAGWASFPWTLGSAVRTPRFWLLGGNTFLSVLTNQMLWVHQAAYLVDNGYERMLAASVVGAAGFLSMPGKILWGMAGDRLGREVTFTIGVCVVLVAIVVLVLIGIFPGLWLVVLFAVSFAAGYAVVAPTAPSAAADIFAGRSFGAIFGALGIFTGLGSALGAWLAGYVFDTTGTYLAAFGAAAACSITGTLLLWIAAPRRVRRVAGRRTAAAGNEAR